MEDDPKLLAMRMLATLSTTDTLKVICAAIWCILEDAGEEYLHIDSDIESGGKVVGVVVLDKRVPQ